MELKGLTINFLGDSITQGVGLSENGKTFHQIIKEKYDLKHAYNYGVAGTRIARQIVASKEFTTYDLCFELRAETMERSADAVVVMGGTNDFAHGDAPFGTYDSDDVFTFCGAVNSLIKKLKMDFPDAKIVFMTPIHMRGEDGPSLPDGKILADYADAIRKICAQHGVCVIDLFKINPLDPTDATLVPDGIHPGDKGHAIMAEFIEKELLKL